MLGRLGLVLAAAAFAGAVLVLVLDRFSENGAERRALIARNADLTHQALTPGSPLACLEVDAGAQVERFCESAVFATARSVAAATAFVGERLRLVAAARALGGETLASLAAERSALARDPFGLVAHVLATRYGCNAEKCDALALLADPATVKGHLASRPFEQLVARYEPVWDKSANVSGPVAAIDPMVPVPGEAEALAKSSTIAHPIDPKYKLPSSDSIPAVSIMTPEPALPKAAPAEHSAEQKAAAPPPLPPKRPQAQAAPAAPPAEPR